MRVCRPVAAMARYAMPRAREAAGRQVFSVVMQLVRLCLAHGKSETSSLTLLNKNNKENENFSLKTLRVSVMTLGHTGTLYTNQHRS